MAIAIPRVYGYPDGFEIELRVISAADGDELDSRLHRAWRQGQLMLGERGLPPPEMLRVAVEFADGSGGGACNWQQSLWVWPLSPPGVITFICEWPALRIPVTRNTIDSQQILAAPSRADVLFPQCQLPLPPWSSNREPQVANQPFVF